MNIQRISLGTAQWGSKYGVSNLNGKTHSSEVYKMLSYASSLGINSLDTAYLYGDAELTLGKYKNISQFEIITKTKKISKSSITKNDVFELINTFNNSLKKMKVDSVYGLLIHNINDILVEGSDYLIEALNKLKDDKMVNRIGISVYDPDDLTLICERLNPDIVQIPLNVLDQRFINSGSLDFLKKKDIEIHARSIFLQGLLFYNRKKFPIFFEKWEKILEKWQTSCHQQGFTFMEAALSFVINIKEIDRFIVGFENIDQFYDCINFFKNKNTNKFDAKNLECNDLNLINPINWKI